MSEFFHMGGYAPFVWSAYGIWAAVMLWIVLSARAKARATRRRLIAKLRAEQAAARGLET